MGFLHMFADARMPIWGAAAIVSNILLVVFTRTGQRWFYAVSLVTLLLFLIVYNRLSNKAHQSSPNRSGKERPQPRQWSRAPGRLE